MYVQKLCARTARRRTPSLYHAARAGTSAPLFPSNTQHCSRELPMRCSSCDSIQMVEHSARLRAKEAGAKGLFKGGLFGMMGVSLMAVLWVGGSRVGEGSMTVSGFYEEHPVREKRLGAGGRG